MIVTATKGQTVFKMCTTSEVKKKKWSIGPIGCHKPCTQLQGEERIPFSSGIYTVGVGHLSGIMVITQKDMGSMVHYLLICPALYLCIILYLHSIKIWFDAGVLFIANVNLYRNNLEFSKDWEITTGAKRGLQEVSFAESPFSWKNYGGSRNFKGNLSSSLLFSTLAPASLMVTLSL